MTHICLGKLAIIWTNAGILFIGPLGTNFSENSIAILTFSFMKMRLKVSSEKWRPFCLSLNVLSLFLYLIRRLIVKCSKLLKLQDLFTNLQIAMKLAIFYPACNICAPSFIPNDTQELVMKHFIRYWTCPCWGGGGGGGGSSFCITHLIIRFPDVSKMQDQSSEFSNHRKCTRCCSRQPRCLPNFKVVLFKLAIKILLDLMIRSFIKYWKEPQMVMIVRHERGDLVSAT